LRSRRDLRCCAHFMHEYSVLANRKNSMPGLRSLNTEAMVTMKIEGLEKLIFTKINFAMKIELETNNERERKKANKVYDMAQKICPLKQSWGEDVPISFELCFL